VTQATLIETSQREVGGEAEHYPTPLQLCRAICATTDEVFRDLYGRTPETIIEPSAGSGNFVRAASERWPESYVHAIDIVDTSQDCYEAGAETFTLGRWEDVWAQARSEHPDLVLGNPPFSLAVPHAEAALRALGHGGGLLALLLRISIEEWTTARTRRSPFPRAAFWPNYPLRARAPVAERASFDGKGTDSTGYALFFWVPGWRPSKTDRGWLLEPIRWRSDS
jgi:hypothetical protein